MSDDVPWPSLQQVEDDLYASGKLRKNGRGELWATVEWQGLTVNGISSGSGAQRGYMLSELVDLDAPDR